MFSLLPHSVNPVPLAESAPLDNRSAIFWGIIRQGPEGSVVAFDWFSLAALGLGRRGGLCSTPASR